MSDWRAIYEGRECGTCGRKRNLLCIHIWHPPIQRRTLGDQVERRGAFVSVRARCFDRPACDARETKTRDRASVRGSRIELSEAPGDPEQRKRPGFCSWCGHPMWRENKEGQRVLDKTRSYHNAEKGEHDCRREHSDSYSYDTRHAVIAKARNEGLTELRCADCATVCEQLGPEGPDSLCICGHARREHAHGTETRVAAMKLVCEVEGCTACHAPNEDQPWYGGFRMFRARWEADHELALEDGGAHSIENLCCRCFRCHRDKTARENAARRVARRYASGVQARAAKADSAGV